MVDVDLLFHYGGDWIRVPEVVYSRKLVHSWKQYDSDLLSFIDIVDEYTSKLRYVGVQQLIIYFLSGKYYEVDGDVGIKTLQSFISDQFNIINLFAVEDSEMGVNVPNIVDHTESSTVDNQAATDCSSNKNEDDSCHHSKLKRSKRMILKSLDDSFVDEYNKIEAYANELRISNPGSDVIINTSKDALAEVNHGDRIAALEGTVEVLRPIVDTVPELRTSLLQRLDDLDRRVLQVEVDVENISRDSEGDRQTAAIEAAEIFEKFEGLQQERTEDLAHRAQEAEKVTATQQTIDKLIDQLNVVNAALQGLLRGGGNQIGGTVNSASATKKLKIPEPKPYSGARNAKEVENFIFDVEQYFDAVRDLEEAKKVATAAMYLQGDAKLWWRVKYEAIKAALLVLGIWASQTASRDLNEASMVQKHEYWMTRFGRVYRDDAEKSKRFKIFNDNVDYIESVNKAGIRPYKLGINEFADLTNEEFRATHNGYKMSSHQKSSKTISFRYENVTAPATMDWRKKGAVTGVKDQGQC
ncbi:senescence-specific cysteine protease sag39, partial [Nicotiana attenuata]